MKIWHNMHMPEKGMELTGQYIFKILKTYQCMILENKQFPMDLLKVTANDSQYYFCGAQGDMLG